MALEAKYVHTNIIAADWRRLADFYIRVFGCRELPPERDFQGPDLEKGTGIKGAHLRGAHLLLPGYESDEPTLEIFTYDSPKETGGKAVDRPGYAHIAFLVDNVEAARREVIAAGGKAVGEIVTLQIAAGEKVTWCYVADIEGNIIELQSRGA